MKLYEKLETLHEWSEEKTLRYEGEHFISGAPEVDEFKAKECLICHAIYRYDRSQYFGCDIMTNYPASDSPCLCTGRQYAEAHGLDYKPGMTYN